MTEVARRFFKGEQVDGAIPQQLHEHLLARHYGWSLEDIRAMSNYDFQVHLRICIERDSAEKEFQLALVGAKVGTKTGYSSGQSGRKGTKEVIHKKFDPIVGDFV